MRQKIPTSRRTALPADHVYSGQNPVRTLGRLLRPDLPRLTLAVVVFIAKHSPIWLLPLITAVILDVVVEHRPVTELWVAAAVLLTNLMWCGAIRRLDPRHAELKSVRTAPIRIRSGIASLLLGHILAEAKAMGFTRLRLETGTSAFFLTRRL